MTSIKLKENLKLDMRRQLLVLNSKRGDENVNSNMTPTIIAAATNLKLCRFNYHEMESPKIRTRKDSLIVPSVLIKPGKKFNGRSLDFEVSLLNSRENKAKIASKNKLRSSHDTIQHKVSKLKRLTSMHRKLQLRQKPEFNNKNAIEAKKLFRPDYTSTPNYNMPKTSTPVLLRNLRKDQTKKDNEKIITATTTTKTTKKMINLAPPKCNCHYFNSTFKDEDPFKINLIDISSSSSCTSSSYCSFSMCKKNKTLKRNTKKNANQQFHHYRNDYINDRQSIFYNYQYMPTTLMKTVKKTTTAKTTNIILSSKEYYHHKEEAKHHHRVNIDYEYLRKKQQRKVNTHNYENIIKKKSNKIYENSKKTNENPIKSSSSKLIKKLKHKKIKTLLQAAAAISSSKCQNNTNKKESKRKFIQKLAKDTKCLMQFENVIRV